MLQTVARNSGDCGRLPVASPSYRRTPFKFGKDLIQVVGVLRRRFSYSSAFWFPSWIDLTPRRFHGFLEMWFVWLSLGGRALRVAAGGRAIVRWDFLTNRRWANHAVTWFCSIGNLRRRRPRFWRGIHGRFTGRGLLVPGLRRIAAVLGFFMGPPYRRSGSTS